MSLLFILTIVASATFLGSIVTIRNKGFWYRFPTWISVITMLVSLTIVIDVLAYIAGYRSFDNATTIIGGFFISILPAAIITLFIVSWLLEPTKRSVNRNH